MTTTQTLDALVKLDSSRTWSATKQAWAYPEYGPRMDRYSIGAQPGFNGAGCQLFNADSLEKCLSMVVEAATIPPTTPNDE